MEEKKRKKAGVMGGTFNPVHIGHLMLAEWAREAASLDEIIFIPTGCSYAKIDKEDILDGAQRLHMVQLAIADREEFTCSDMEVRRGGNTYTYETMEQLKADHPETDYYFIMGADCLYTIETWSRAEKIFEACSIIAAARNGSPIDEMAVKCRELEKRYHGEIQLLPFMSVQISSTEIRSRVKEGHSIRYLVPEAVEKYIAEKQFYRK